MSRRVRASGGRLPRTVATPLVGAMRSAMTRNRVDLPQPEGPSNVIKLPVGTSIETSCSAVTVPQSAVKRTVTLSQTTAYAVATGATVADYTVAPTIVRRASAG